MKYRTQQGGRRGRAGCGGRAFTLIELLVVISIIALLMSILLPSLAGARRRARGTVGMANLRSLSQILMVYTNDHQEQFVNPFRKQWTTLPNGYTPTWAEAVSSENPNFHWNFASPDPHYHTEGFSGMWYSYLSDYRAGQRLSQEQFSPNDAELMGQYRDAKGVASSYNGDKLFPTSFLYSPTFWCKADRYGGVTRDVMTADAIRTSAIADVAHPAAKVVLWERADFSEVRTKETTNFQGRINIALVDGSIDVADISDIAMRAANQVADRDLNPCYVDSARTIPLFFYATFRGLNGRDIPRF
jgi:prepilin-type N-terminal cleavage/methylation domain-containing protein